MTHVKQRTTVRDLVAEGDAVIVFRDKLQIHAIPIGGLSPTSVTTEIAADVVNILNKADASLGDTISAGEIDVLSRYRTGTDADVAIALARATRLRNDILESTRTVDAVARLLGVNGSRIRQRLADRSIYGIKQGNKWRIPGWQFDDNGILPGIADVNRAVDHNVDIVALHGFLHTPNVDLEFGGEPISPLAWLRAGHDPEPVEQIASTL